MRSWGILELFGGNSGEWSGLRRGWGLACCSSPPKRDGENAVHREVRFRTPCVPLFYDEARKVSTML